MPPYCSSDAQTGKPEDGPTALTQKLKMVWWVGAVQARCARHASCLPPIPIELLHVSPAVPCQAAVVTFQHLGLQALVYHLTKGGAAVRGSAATLALEHHTMASLGAHSQGATQVILSEHNIETCRVWDLMPFCTVVLALSLPMQCMQCNCCARQAIKQ
jgi:hypothetical protein